MLIFPIIIKINDHIISIVVSVEQQSPTIGDEYLIKRWILSVQLAGIGFLASGMSILLTHELNEFRLIGPILALVLAASLIIKRVVNIDEQTVIAYLVKKIEKKYKDYNNVVALNQYMMFGQQNENT